MSKEQTTDLWRRSAGELAREAADPHGEGAAGILESHLARIAAVNPAVNAIVDVMAESARAQARELDAARDAGQDLGRLAGVPLTVKSELNVAGSPSTCGVVALRDRVPAADSPSVARLRAAGCVIVGRTNQPDLGQRLHTDCDLYGPTLNPWDPRLTPAGSSGGDAVAVATGMAPLGLGTDMGGSLRMPAYCCGVCALKPSLGRVPRFSETHGVGVAEQLACVVGPLARHTADLRLALRVLEGADPSDPESLAVAAPPPPPLAGLSVALAEPPAGTMWPAPVTLALERAAGALEEAGCMLSRAQPPSPEAGMASFLKLVLAEGAEREPEGITYSPGVRRFWELVRGAAPVSKAADLGDALAERYEQAAAWARFFAEHPLLVAPVWTCPPWPVGFDIAGPEEAMEVFWHDRYTLTVNLLGLPAVALPTGLVDGLPTGLQLIGARFADDLCLDAAEAVEARLGRLTPMTPRGGAAAGEAASRDGTTTPGSRPARGGAA